MIKFYKSRKWRNNKNWFLTNSRKNYGSWIAFCFFAFKTKLMNLSSLLWKLVSKKNMKTMTSNKLGGSLLCLPWPQRFEKKKLSMLVTRYLKIYLNTSADSYYQHRIRRKTGIPLENFPNVFKSLKLSLALLKFLIWH